MTIDYELKTLIDKAAEMCGSQSELARKLGWAPQKLTNIKNGMRKAQPSDKAAIAGLAGYDAIQILARATVEEAEGTKKGDVLKQSLGKYLLATGAAIASSSAGATVNESVSHLIRCISCQVEKARMRAFFWPAFLYEGQ